MNIAFAGGGTGGHLFPGLAVAELARRHPDVGHVVFFGAERGIETRIVPQQGYELISQRLSALRGRSPLAALGGLSRLARAAWRARGEIRRRRIDVVVGLGGYASAAAVIGARLAGRPVVLLEQNRDPGLATRILALCASAVCTSFEETAARLPARRVRCTGNPVRPDLERLAGKGSRHALLVFGGSAGAASVNRAVVEAVRRLRENGTPVPPILHQSGAAHEEDTRRAYENAGVEATVVGFIADVAAAYSQARLAVCRAGATTVAELTATGTPAILIPYPYATGDHQTANARSLEQAGAAVVLADREDLADRLADTLSRLLDDHERLDSMAASAAALARPGAAERVLQTALAVGAAGRARRSS